MLGNINILALTRYSRLGGSSRLRFMDYLPYLADHDINVDFQPFFDDIYLQRKYLAEPNRILDILKYYYQRLLSLKNIKNYNLVWLEKEALPWLPSLIELPFFRQRPFVVDFDDAWFHRYDLHTNKFVHILLRNKFPSLIRESQLTIVGNTYLKDWAASMGSKNILELPTPIDLKRYTLQASTEKRLPIVGWMGSPSTAGYLKDIAPILKRMADQNLITLKIIGAGIEAVSELKEYIFPWSEASEVEDLSSFDIGIMPLIDDPWSRGKCAYKLLQYMAVGRPVIASPVGMNNQVVQNKANGFLAETLDDWVNAILELKQNPALRLQMGLNGRRLMEQKYNLDVLAPILIENLRAVALGCAHN